LMRILLFTQQLAAFRSGVGTYVNALINGLRHLGHQITAVVPEGEDIEIPDLRILTVSHSRFDPTPGGWLSLGTSFAKILSNEAMKYDEGISDMEECLRDLRNVRIYVAENRRSN